MKKLFLALTTFVSLAAFAQDKTVVNDANAEKRTLSGSFTAISVSDGVDLYLTQGTEESIAVSAAETKYMEKFKTEVVNGTLKIYYDNKGLNWSGNERKKLTASVSFKTLEKLSAGGGAYVEMKGNLTSSSLDMKFTSGSHFKGTVKTTALTVDQSSGSHIDVTGSTDKLNVEVSSGAQFRGFELKTDFCEAKATSGASVRITINKELNAKANSGGAVKYKGEAVMKDLNVSSGGSVKKSS